jgi:hypothetical protein
MEREVPSFFEAWTSVREKLPTEEKQDFED